MPTTLTIPTLEGRHVRLEPLTLDHLPALEQVALGPDAERIWHFTNTWVKTPADLRAYVESALHMAATGTSMPWVTILKSTTADTPDQAIGSTRFADLDLHHRTTELGYTWIAPTYQGTAVNPEAKLLQLTYAFETLNLRRVGLKTHHENLHSQAAMRKLGAQYEGTFRNHMISPDGSQRHSVWFSITAEDWPEIKAELQKRLKDIYVMNNEKRTRRFS